MNSIPAWSQKRTLEKKINKKNSCPSNLHDVQLFFYFVSVSLSEIANVISHWHATCPSTVATAEPLPIGPRSLVISTDSSKVSPGVTCFLKRHLSMPAKNASFP